MDPFVTYDGQRLTYTRGRHAAMQQRPGVAASSMVGDRIESMDGSVVIEVQRELRECFYVVRVVKWRGEEVGVNVAVEGACANDMYNELAGLMPQVLEEAARCSTGSATHWSGVSLSKSIKRAGFVGQGR